MDFEFKYQAVAVVSTFIALAAILELIRRRRIQDVLWLPWLAVAIAPALVGLWVAPWATLARWLGIAYEPLLLLVGASLLSFAMLLYLSVVVSTLIRRNLKLAQELAVLRHKVESLEASSESE